MIKRDKLGRFVSTNKAQKHAVTKKSVKSTSNKKPTKKAVRKTK